MRTSIIVIISILLLNSCTSQVEPKENIVEVKTSTISLNSDNSEPTDIKYNDILEGVVCKYDNKTKYSLYIPTSDTLKGCIVFLDPQGEAALPLRFYSPIADELGFALIGCEFFSNHSTYDESQAGFNAILNETRTELNLSKDQIILGGFSGGGKVAAWLAFDYAITQIFSVGSGLPTNGKELVQDRNYYIFCGHEDFNFKDVKQLKNDLTSKDHFVGLFEGKHEWPSVQDFKNIAYWGYFNLMKANTIAKDQALIDKVYNEMNVNLAQIENMKAYVKLSNYNYGISLFDELAPIDIFKTLKTDFKESRSYAVYTKQSIVANYTEGVWQNKFTQGITDQQDVVWWYEQLRLLENEISSAPNLNTKEALIRVRKFVSLLCFIQTELAINKNDQFKTNQFLSVFEKVDSENADVLYFKAILEMQNGNSTQAMTYLNEMMLKGFTNEKKIRESKWFTGLISDLQFRELFN